MLRANLNEILAQRRKVESTTATGPAPSTQISAKVSDSIPGLQIDAAGTVRHELSPAIGWIRLAADREIADFAASSTNLAITKLQRRIDGLVALLKEDALVVETISIRELVLMSWPDPSSEPIFEPAPERADLDLELSTDANLFSTMLTNVYQNAIDASGDRAGRSVRTTWGRTQDRFWLRVTNPFAGEHFQLGDVVGTGVTSKAGHQGRGVSLISKAARQLEVLFTLEGRSGTATASIAGRIKHG